MTAAHPTDRDLDDLLLGKLAKSRVLKRLRAELGGLVE
jgi:hypothetical protein